VTQRILIAVLTTVVLLLTGLTAATAEDGTPHVMGRHTEANRFQTTRMFSMGAGHETRTFTLRERTGVILVNRLTVVDGVRAYVVARIPHVAGARVNSWPSRADPSLSCRRRGAHQICMQGEEWCPMPQATWHFRLVKLRGPAGPIRFQYRVAPPPAQRSGAA
jgi:hypothetical protein